MYCALKVFAIGTVEFTARREKAWGWALRTWKGTLPACARCAFMRKERQKGMKGHMQAGIMSVGRVGGREGDGSQLSGK